MSLNLTRALIDEIREDCPRCDGMGQYHVPPPTRLAPGEKSPEPRRAHCWDCNGRGWVLTEWGRLLADVFKVVLADEFASKDHVHNLT